MEFSPNFTLKSAAIISAGVTLSETGIGICWRRHGNFRCVSTANPGDETKWLVQLVRKPHPKTFGLPDWSRAPTLGACLTAGNERRRVETQQRYQYPK